jgi:hypothetical protein
LGKSARRKHQFPLDGRLGVIVGDDGCFERFVVVCILQRADDSFGRKTVADSFSAGSPLAFFVDRTGAFAALRRLASNRLKLGMVRQPQLASFCQFGRGTDAGSGGGSAASDWL